MPDDSQRIKSPLLPRQSVTAKPTTIETVHKKIIKTVSGIGASLKPHKTSYGNVSPTAGVDLPLRKSESQPVIPHEITIPINGDRSIPKPTPRKKSPNYPLYAKVSTDSSVDSEASVDLSERLSSGTEPGSGMKKPVRRISLGVEKTFPETDAELLKMLEDEKNPHSDLHLLKQNRKFIFTIFT